MIANPNFPSEKTCSFSLHKSRKNANTKTQKKCPNGERKFNGRLWQPTFKNNEQFFFLITIWVAFEHENSNMAAIKLNWFGQSHYFLIEKKHFIIPEYVICMENIEVIFNSSEKMKNFHSSVMIWDIFFERF